MTLEDELAGQTVYVEAQLYGGEQSEKTQMYMGTYKCTDSLAGREVLVLTRAHYFNLANILSGLKNASDAEKFKIKSDLLVIPWSNILSVAKKEVQ